MILTFSPRKATFVCSSSKAKILNQLQGKGPVEIDVRVKGKDEASASELPAAT